MLESKDLEGGGVAAFGVLGSVKRQLRSYFEITRSRKRKGSIKNGPCRKVYAHNRRLGVRIQLGTVCKLQIRASLKG